MKILLAGSSGFIGSALTPFLTQQGYQVVRLVRSQDQLTDQTAFWDPQGDDIDLQKLDRIGGDEGIKAVINLAGEDMSKKRWTPEVKEVIRESRIRSTKLLSETLAKLRLKPGLLVNASAVGIYGNRAAEVLDEDSRPGEGFLADLAKDWEAATYPAADAGIRVVRSRFGIVFSAKGGALKKLIGMAKIGGAAPWGEGAQYMSWIVIDDLLRAFKHVISTESLSGPVNFVSTNPMKNVEFSHSMQYYFKAPLTLHIPAFILRMVIGEIADEVLLTSQRVLPTKLTRTGFKFRYTQLEPALRYLTSEKLQPGEV